MWSYINYARDLKFDGSVTKTLATSYAGGEARTRVSREDPSGAFVDEKGEAIAETDLDPSTLVPIDIQDRVAKLLVAVLGLRGDDFAYVGLEVRDPKQRLMVVLKDDTNGTISYDVADASLLGVVVEDAVRDLIAGVESIMNVDRVEVPVDADAIAKLAAGDAVEVALDGKRVRLAPQQNPTTRTRNP